MSEFNKIIKVNKGKKFSIDAKDLHKFLETKTEFSLWFKRRVKKYDFIENSDFVRMETIAKTPFGSNGGVVVGYNIRIGMAKELSMVENTDKGKEARRYFIKIEETYRSSRLSLQNSRKPPTDYIESLKEIIRLEEENHKTLVQNDILTHHKNSNADLLTYANDVLSSDDLFTTTQIAMNFNMTANALNKKLEELGIQYKQGLYWVLKAKYKKMDIAGNVVYVYDSSTKKGNKHTVMRLKWSQKGMKFITDLLAQQQDNK